MTNPVLIIHVATALASIAGFIFRGILIFNNLDMARQKWLKITPHIVDTVLIISAITLFIESGLDLLQTQWLIAKIIALIAYIALGLVAFRFGKTLAFRLIAWCGAIAVFCYILAVAVTKNPMVVF